jgi:hypothetical protein
MDLREAAEERASHSRKQLKTAQDDKIRHSMRNRAVTIKDPPTDLADIDLNPESNIEVDNNPSSQSVESFPAASHHSLTLVEHPTKAGPYRETNQQYNLTKRAQNARPALNRVGPESPVREHLAEMYLDSVSQENMTPKLAKLNESDYKLNGTRARALSDSNEPTFLRPRWIPDESQETCMVCTRDFDFFNRRHHCRNCGHLVCESCSEHKLFLPPEFGIRDPERVCATCYEELLPLQSDPSFLNNRMTMNNFERENSILPIFDNDFSSCHIRRYTNLPFSFTLGSEIRKAAYSVYNLFTTQYLQDGGIPLKLLSQAKGIAFLTVVKAGLMFAPRIGTGLVVSRLSFDPRDPRPWSAPSAIGTVGLSWGAIIGFDLTDYVIILNTASAVEAFCSSAQVTLGGGLEIAMGPVGEFFSILFSYSFFLFFYYSNSLLNS